MTLTRNRFSYLAVAAVIGAMAGVGLLQVQSAQASLVSLSNIDSGDLIRGESFSAVYYVGADGFRYVFPNDKTYATWYSDFGNVKFISDADLAKIQIGGNVTYKPGVKMVKINTANNTYAVEAGGVLRHVTGESLAVSLYGTAWNTMIDDVPDGFFSNYTVGEPINSANDYNVAEQKAEATSINVDKNLSAPAEISITNSAYSPISVNIEAGQAVRFTNNGTTAHTATSDDLNWGSGTLQPGDSFIRVFKTEGTYTFFDSYNGALTGAVFVE